MKCAILSLSCVSAAIQICPAAEVPQFERLQLSEEFYAEGIHAGDFNKDGKMDVVSGPYWYAGPDFAKRKALYDTKSYPPKGYSKNFNTWGYDVNGDGWDDVLRVTFPGDKVLWHENPKGDGAWKEHVAVDKLDNESPQFGDINGDGQPDLAGSIGGQFVYFTFTKGRAADKWIRHNISSPKSTGGRFTHGLGIGDVDGDGRIDLLDKGHWWRQPKSLDGDPLWQEFRFQFSGPGGADMFAYDFDGDGDNDIYTSSAAHGYGLRWFEQTRDDDGKKGWQPHAITGKKAGDSPHGVVFSQAHSAQLCDIDGDGVKDLVTGKRWWAHNGNDPGGNDAAVLYWFKVIPGGKSGEAQFIPYQIDNDSGVGTQFLVVDLNGDSKADILASNKKGTFLHIQRGVGEQKPGPRD
ncbi:MAG: VCBS repeat-containing protein [Verrucomicrobiales bacterium]